MEPESFSLTQSLLGKPEKKEENKEQKRSSRHKEELKVQTKKEDEALYDKFDEGLKEILEKEETENKKEEKKSPLRPKPTEAKPEKFGLGPEDYVQVLQDGTLLFAEVLGEDLGLKRMSTLSKYASSVDGGSNLPPMKKGVSAMMTEKMAKEKTADISQATKTQPDQGIADDEHSQRVKEAMKKRKVMRYGAYFCYLIILGIFLTLLFKFAMVRDSLFLSNNSAPNAALRFNIDNCTLYIADPADNEVPGPIYVKYQMPTGFKSDLSSSSQLITENSLSLDVLNGEDSYYCLIQLFIQSATTQIESLEINCVRCNITQDTSSQLQVNGLLNVTGEIMNANFKDIKVGSFSYQSVTGYLQLNNIESEAQVNNIVMSNRGDIIIQSTQDFLVNATTNTQAFCLAGATLASRDNGTCSYADQGEQPSNEDCTLSWTVCSSQDCNPTTFPTYVVNSNNGNVYANAIPSVGNPVVPGQVVSGQIYNQGISFSTEADQALSSFDQLVADQSKGNPFILLNLGDNGSRSSKYTKWVVSSAPTYALMKPWWIGTVSASVLNGYVEQTNGFLLPGFCPFYPDYTTEELLKIQNLIASKIAVPNALITFVNDISIPEPSDFHGVNSGIFPLIEKGNPSDKWLSLGLSPSGDIIIENNDYTKRGQILATIIVSLLIAVYVTYLTLTIVCVSINVMYTKLVNFTNHLENYSKLQQSKSADEQQQQQPFETKKKSKKVIDERDSITNVFKHAPSPLAFIDYLSLIFFRQFTNSVAQFYYLLFTEQTDDIDEELDPNKNMMKGTEAKTLYEKFCFMNHLNEQKLTDPVNQAVLRTYGFEIVTREDLRAEVFTRLNIKKKSPFLVSSKQLKQGNSLDCYIRENVKLTQFDEDQIEVNEFVRLYSEFCSYNRLSRVAISPSLMREKYGINVDVVPQQYIMKIQNNKDNRDLLEPDASIYRKLMFLWRKGQSPSKKYILHKSKLQNHFKLLLKQTQDMTDDQLDKATSDLILYPGWRVWDAITVFLHFLLGALITVPLVFFVALNESQYEPWSLKDSLYLIRFEDITHNPSQFVLNLYNSFTWNVILMIVATVLWVVFFFDLILYYAIMEFPQDKSFKKSETKTKESYLHKRTRQLEWLFVMIALAFYLGYIGLILTWLMLGAFINPGAFLPFASAAATFVVFVVSKYKSFKDLSKQGTKIISNYVNKLFSSFTNKVLAKISKNLEKVGKLQQQKEAQSESKPEKGPIDSTSVSIEVGPNVQASSDIFSGEAEALSSPQKDQASKKSVVPVDLRLKKLRKIKEECDKRKIPVKFTNFMLAVYLQDPTRMPHFFRTLVQDLNTKLSFDREAADIITELVFPQGIKKEETVLFINLLIMDHIFKKATMGNVKGLTGEVLYDIFMMFKQVDESNYGHFMQSFKHRLDISKLPKLEQVKYFLPILDIAAIASKDKPDHWNLKHPCFRLFRMAEYLLAADKTITKEQMEGHTKTLQDFIKFLPLLFSLYEVPYDVDDPKNLLDSKETLDLIENFCDAIGVRQFEIEDENDQENKRKKPVSVADLIYLGIAMIKHEAGDLPRRVTKAIEEVFRTDLPSNKFLPFCLNLINVLYNNPTLFYLRMDKSANIYGIPMELQNLLKIITCANLQGFESYYSFSFIEKNPYFTRMAQSMKASPKELLGLIDLIYGKGDSTYVPYFFQSILTRMNLDPSLLEILISLCNLFFTRSEHTLFQAAIKDLYLDLPEFLFMGKGIVNPRFIPVSLFEEVGIHNPVLLEQKNTIFYSSPEQFNAWKTEIRKELTDNVSRYRTLYEENRKKYPNAKHPSVFEAQATLVKFYMSDWKAFTYSKKNLNSVIEIMSNPVNRLKKKIVETDPGKDYSGVDYLTKVMNVINLRPKSGKKFSRLDKEKEGAIFTIAEAMGLNPEPFEDFLKLFLLNDKDTVMKSLFTFFPEEHENKTEISKILSFGFRQVTGIQRQIDFIGNDFSDSIDFFGDENTRIPANLIKKINYGASYGDLDMSDIQELISMKLGSLKQKLSKETEEKVRAYCIDLNLFSRGLIPDPMDYNASYNIRVNDQKIRSLIEIFSDANFDKKNSQITKIFPRLSNDADHPFKVAVAFSGLLTHSRFEICKAEGTETVQTITSYLGEVFKVYPEVLDLFYIIFERDVPKFFQKALPLMRRLTKSSILDTNMLESLFSLAVGEKFNPYNLSEKLGLPIDVIDFFMTLVRLASSKHLRKKELNVVNDSIPVQQVLSRLRIEPKEFFSLLKLVFNEFEVTEKGITEIIDDLKLKDEDGNSLIPIDFIRGMISVTAVKDPKLDIFNSKKASANLQNKTSTFWNSIDMMEKKEDAFIIARLAAGEFLVLDEFKDHLAWVFPTHDEIAGRAILKLTMGLCGLINPNVEIYSDLDKDVEDFVDEFYPKKNLPFAEPDYKQGSGVLPNNSLAYAIFLTYQALDIPPKWTEAFLFDKKGIISISESIPSIKQEFILAVVLQFKSLNDVTGDLLGLHDFTIRCWREFYLQRREAPSKEGRVDFFMSREDGIFEFFYNRMTFEYQSVKDMAASNGLLSDSHWAELFKDVKTYNTKINQSLFYLLTLKYSNEEKKDLALRFQFECGFDESPVRFLEHLANFKGEIIPEEKRKKIFGQKIRDAFINAYEIVHEKIYEAKPRYPGYAITNLCMLANLTSLRASFTFSFQRKLHFLHQISLNIERILLLDDVFFKMSKYKLIKLMGICLNMRISNIAEWCLVPSLFTNEYVTKLELARSEEEREKVREEKCGIIFYKWNDPIPALPEEKAEKYPFYVGDLGNFGGNFKDFGTFMEQIFEAENWNALNLALEYDANYYEHPQAENVQAGLQRDTDFMREAYDECYVDRMICCPLEQFLIIHEAQETESEVKIGLRKFTQARKTYNNPNLNKKQDESEEKALENVIDIKTGLPYKEVLEKSKNFEKTLMSANIALIQGIIRGDPTEILQGDHVLNNMDSSKERTKVFVALIGILSYKKKEKKDKLAFRSYLRSLANYIESDIVTLDEILHFLVTRKGLFGELSNILGIDDNQLDFLLVSLQGKSDSTDEDEDREEKSKSSFIDTISKVSRGIPREHLEALDLIRKIYLLKDPKAWVEVIGKLIKPEVNEKKLLTNLFGGLLNIPTPKQENKKHPLVTFVEMLDFSKLKEQVNRGEDKKLSRAFTINFRQFRDCMMFMLERVILPLDCYKDFAFQYKEWKRLYYVVNLLIQHDFARVFEIIVLQNEKLEDPQQKWAKVENLLREFGIKVEDPLVKQDLKYFVLYITLAQNNIGSFRTNSKYNVAINHILDDIVNEKILDPYKNTAPVTPDEQKESGLSLTPKFQRELSELLVGALAWDFNLCIKSLATPTSVNQGYLLYSLYACLNMNKVLSVSESLKTPPSVHLKALLPLIFPALLSKSAPSVFRVDLKEVYLHNMKEHLGTDKITRDTAEALKRESDILFEEIQKFDNKKQPKTLSYHICQTFEEGLSDTLTIGKNYQTFEDILCSFCDGTILIKLINTFVDIETEEKPAQKTLKNLFHLLLEFKSFHGGNNEGIHVREAFVEVIESVNKPGEKKLWDIVTSLAQEKILNILLMPQKDGRPDVAKHKEDVLDILMGLVDLIRAPEQKSLVTDTMSIMVKTDMNAFNNTRGVAKIRYDMESSETLEIFFGRICDRFFPGLCRDKWFVDLQQQIYLLISLLNLDYLQKINDPISRCNVVMDVLNTLEKLKICSESQIKALLSLLQGKPTNCEYLLCDLDNQLTVDIAKLILNYFKEIEQYFKPEPTSTSNEPKMISVAPAINLQAAQVGRKKIDPDEWTQMMKKIKDGTASSRDLFRIVDQEGDNSGAINEAEFLVLAGRLNLKLSEHRVKEIFAKVKGNKVQEGDYDELNEEEFEKALTYLQEKSLQQALELLGITPEMLTAILIKLVILLLLIFVFIFLGIKAFAIGGTFGSIINSVFPAAGGLALGKEKQGQENVDEENVTDATDKGFEIATSGEL